MLATEELSIRPYTVEDEAFIAELARDAFLEYTPRAVSHTLGLVRRCTTFVAQRALRRGEAPRLELGALGGPPRLLPRVGFAAVGDDGGGMLSLYAIAVSRGERGRGIGERLMVEVEVLASQRGARRLELCTADYNLAALDLFYRRGFRLLHRRPRFYERGQDACVLVKELG